VFTSFSPLFRSKCFEITPQSTRRLRPLLLKSALTIPYAFPEFEESIRLAVTVDSSPTDMTPFRTLPSKGCPVLAVAVATKHAGGWSTQTVRRYLTGSRYFRHAPGASAVLLNTLNQL
jgi:hypothetical protein